MSKITTYTKTPGGEQKLQSTLSQIAFDTLNKIDADELGRRDIKIIVEKMKQSITDSLSAYVDEEESYCLPLHIELKNLEELLRDPLIDSDEIADELSLLSTAIVVYNLSHYYKNSLLSSNRNDHHAYMFQVVNSFACDFYRDYLVDGAEFYIVRHNCTIMDYEMDFLLHWLEFGTPETKEEWIL